MEKSAAPKDFILVYIRFQSAIGYSSTGRKWSSLRVPERDARRAQIVWGHLDIDLVADADPDEVFAHLARNVGKYLMPIG